MKNNKRIEGNKSVVQAQQLKMPKRETNQKISIDDLNGHKTGNLFEGDVIVTYRTHLDKAKNAVEVFRADLTDSKGEMTITLNLTGTFVPMFEKQFFPGTSIRITTFRIAPKTTYDHGDYDCIMLLTETSTIETIPRTCPKYVFIPSTTISRLLQSTDSYTVGTIGAIVLESKRMAFQYMLSIKDGDIEYDSAQIFLHPNLLEQFTAIEGRVQNKDYPLMLFKNIVKRSDSKDRTLRSCQSTYIAPLTNKTTFDTLQKLFQSTYQVYGLLKVANPFSILFQPTCTKCNSTLFNFGMLKDDIGHCNKCNEDVAYTYTHNLKCILTTDNKNNLQCSLEKHMFTRLLPQLQQISYEEYLQNKTKVVFIVREFQVEGNFTLDQNNIILDLQQNQLTRNTSSSQMTEA